MEDLLGNGLPAVRVQIGLHADLLEFAVAARRGELKHHLLVPALYALARFYDLLRQALVELRDREQPVWGVRLVHFRIAGLRGVAFRNALIVPSRVLLQTGSGLSVFLKYLFVGYMFVYVCRDRNGAGFRCAGDLLAGVAVPAKMRWVRHARIPLILYISLR